jgi:Ricin-type beta-trefoil lectin domain-like
MITVADALTEGNPMSRNFRRMWTVLVASAGLLAGFATTAQAATTYQFVNVRSVKCMSVAGSSTANNARIVIATCNGSATVQKWVQENRDAQGYYRYRNVNSGKCLSVTGASTASGATIIQYTCNGAAEQQWGLNYSDSHFHLENRKSGLAITVSGGATADNTGLVQQAYASGTHQLWEPN